MITRKTLCIAFMLAAACVAQAQQPSDNEVKVLHVRGPIYMIAAGGGNITASIGPDGVLLVDTGKADMAEKVKAAIQEIQVARVLFEDQTLDTCRWNLDI